MPSHYKEKTVRQADKEGAFSGNKAVPFIPSQHQTSFNPRWWSSQNARNKLTDSYIASGETPEAAARLADENLAGRIRDVGNVDYEVTGLKDARAEARTGDLSGQIRGGRGLVSVAPTSLQQDPTSLLTHEGAHIGTSQGDRLTEADRRLIAENEPNIKGADRKLFNTTGLEQDTANEIYSRMQVFRQAGADEGIFDPTKESFTGEHYDAMMDAYGTGEAGVTNPDQKADNIQQFLRNTNKETAIGMLNKIAQAQPRKKQPWGFNGSSFA
jgi:hypothetical protein